MTRLVGNFLRLFLCVLAVVMFASEGAARDAAGLKLRKSVSDYERTIQQGAMLGTAIGAGVGALIGSRNGKQGALNGALIGGAVGSIIGGLTGKSVADSKAQQIGRENSLDAQIAQARASNRKLSSLAAVSRDLVRRRQDELSLLKRSKASARIAQKKTLLKDLKEDRRAMDEALRLARSSRNSLQSGIENYQSAGDLRNEAAKTDGAIDSLQQDRTQIDRLIRGAS